MFLAYSKEVGGDNVIFEVEGSLLHQDGFRRQWGTDGTLTLGANDHDSISYYNPGTKTRFDVVPGSFLGQPWAHVSFLGDNFDPEHARPSQVETMHSATLGWQGNSYWLVKHLHLPNTLSGIQLTYRRLAQPNSHQLSLAVTPCSGKRCPSSVTWKAFDSVSAWLRAGGVD